MGNSLNMNSTKEEHSNISVHVPFSISSSFLGESGDSKQNVFKVGHTYSNTLFLYITQILLRISPMLTP